MCNQRLAAAFAVILLTTIVAISSSALADPPVVHESNTQATPAVKGTNSAGGDGIVGEGRRGVVGVSKEFQGIFGSSQDNAGVVGESQRMHGVFGITHGNNSAGIFGTSADGRGVIGVSERNTAVEGNSKDGTGVWGVTESPNAAGGEFHNSGGGDLVRAGKNTEFRVTNNGDVLVRGQKIGAAGSQGVQGPKGDPGPAGLPTKTIAACGSSCSCQSGRTISIIFSTLENPLGCMVTSETGSCQINTGSAGSCCVCAPN